MPDNAISRRAAIAGLAVGGAACAFGSVADVAAAAPRAPRLRRRAPEDLGVNSDGIAAFVNEVNSRVGGLHSFMLLRRGQVVAEAWWAPYAPARRHALFSLSKSFTSTAVGIAVDEGRLTLDQRVVSFFPDDLPGRVGDNLAAMQVRHLLSMVTGHDSDATGGAVSDPSGNWVRGFLAQPVQHAPGTKFVYNSAATYVCSAIVQKLTGATVTDYLTPRLFAPLGIVGATWDKCPRGIDAGGWGLSVKTEDIARFGQLYLDRGVWRGRRLVSEAWVQAATSKQVSNGDGGDSDWTQGYGYQFWRCRHANFRGDGAFGQYCVVMPGYDAVLAVTSGVGDMQAVLNAVWAHLLPAMAPDAGHGDRDALRSALAGLTVPSPQGLGAPAAARRVSGADIRFDGQGEIAGARLTFSGDRCRVRLTDRMGSTTLGAGRTAWVQGKTRLGDGPDAPVAARGAWTSPDTYTVTVCLVETPFVETHTWRFDGDAVTLDRKVNVGFGPTERPRLTGRVVRA